MDDAMPPEDLPPLPDSYFIPKGVVERWQAIPANERVSLHLTRSEIDQLFFTISRLSAAQTYFRESMVSWTGGDLEQANRLNRRSQQEEIESMNALRSFFAAVMSGAKRENESRAGAKTPHLIRMLWRRRRGSAIAIREGSTAGTEATCWRDWRLLKAN